MCTGCCEGELQVHMLWSNSSVITQLNLQWLLCYCLVVISFWRRCSLAPTVAPTGCNCGSFGCPCTNQVACYRCTGASWCIDSRALLV